MNYRLFDTCTAPRVYRLDPLQYTLGENVAWLRMEQSLNKKTFARMAGVSRPYLNAIEDGQADIRLSYMQRLADALCVDPIMLLACGLDYEPLRLLVEMSQGMRL